MLRPHAQRDRLAGIRLDHRAAAIGNGQPDVPGKNANATAIGPLDAAVEKVHPRAAEARGHEAIAGPVVERLRIGHLLQAAVAEDRDPLAQGHRLAGIVRHVDHRHAQPLVQAADLVAQLAAKGGIEARQRLIEQEQLGPADDRPAQGHALLLAVGKFARPAIQQFGNAQRGGGLFHARPDLALGGSPQFQSEAQVAADRQMRIERLMLKDHGHVAIPRRQPFRRPTGNDDPAGGGLLQPGEQPERRRLAAAGGPHEDQQFVVLDLQAEVIHGANPAGKGLAEMGDYDRRHERIVAS